jgi:hypothetical protein
VREVSERVAGSRDVNEPGPVDYGNILRVYAGQPNPDDASHFVIPYRMDGHDGAIDGWIKAGGIEMHPRNGRWYFDGVDVIRLDAPPATRPTIYPLPAPG